MKTVYRNAIEVMHIWAQQGEHDVRCGNAHTVGTALYSYATPVANFVTNKKGKRAVLVTTERYSVTTSQNMPSANDIAGLPTFKVRHIGVTGGRSPYPQNRDSYHAENVAALRTEYTELLKKLSRARSGADYIERQLIELQTRAREYSKFFGVRWVSSHFPAIDADTLAKAKEKAAADTKRKAIANAARRAELQIVAEKDAARFLSGAISYLPWGVMNHATIATCESVRRHAIALWRMGKLDSMGHDITSETLLRVKIDTIETSRGAVFPLSHALVALACIRAVVARGEPWHRNGKTLHLGHYQIDRIAANGDVVAGCHSISYAEIERVAATIKKEA